MQLGDSEAFSAENDRAGSAYEFAQWDQQDVIHRMVLCGKMVDVWKTLSPLRDVVLDFRPGVVEANVQSGFCFPNILF